MTLGLSSDWSTSAGLAQYLMDKVYNRLPDDYYAALRPQHQREVAGRGDGRRGQLIGNRALTWIVAGDLDEDRGQYPQAQSRRGQSDRR